MMGSGKSTVGKRLAEKLSYRFFDTDDVIEKSLGATVSQIFDENGEEIFRDIETKVLQELSQYARSVISTGGGAVLSRENWGNMRHGIVVFLSGDPKTLASRIQGEEKENRPLLNDVEESQQEGLVTKLSGILEEREKFYNEADIVVLLEDVDTGAVLSPESLTGSIMEKLAKAIQDKKKEVEEKKDFKIEGMPDSMQVREPYETTATEKQSAPKGFQKKKD
jgi:shikimate kinase